MPDPDLTQKPPAEKKSGVGKILAIMCGGLLAFILVIALVPGRDGNENEMAEQQRMDDTTAAPQPGLQTTPTAAGAPADSSSGDSLSSKRIGKSRKDMMKGFEDAKLGFTFEKATNVDGLESYFGSSDLYKGVSMQLVGPADDLALASMSIGVTRDTALYAQHLALLIEFAGRLGSDVMKWTAGTAKDHEGKGNFQKSERFAGRTVHLQFVRINEKIGFLTLKATP